MLNKIFNVNCSQLSEDQNKYLGNNKLELIQLSGGQLLVLRQLKKSAQHKNDNWPKKWLS